MNSLFNVLKSKSVAIIAACFAVIVNLIFAIGYSAEIGGYEGSAGEIVNTVFSFLIFAIVLVAFILSLANDKQDIAKVMSAIIIGLMVVQIPGAISTLATLEYLNAAGMACGILAFIAFVFIATAIVLMIVGKFVKLSETVKTVISILLFAGAILLFGASIAIWCNSWYSGFSILGQAFLSILLINGKENI